MARLESQAKAGFYPTPDSVCDLLTTKLDIEEGARVLDPCCGKGITLSRLGSCGIKYGIELDHQRAHEARGRLFQVLWVDALIEVRISPDAFNLLYLNPPYDHAIAAMNKERRLEEQFLRRYLGQLKNGGYLILVNRQRKLQMERKDSGEPYAVKAARTVRRGDDSQSDNR